MYFRQVADVDGRVYKRFAIPRFLCRRKGPHRSQHVTFSILPEALVARRRFSLPLMIWVLKLLLSGRQSVAQVLEALMALSPEGEEAFAVEEERVYRILDLFSGVYVRLQSFPVAQAPLPAALQQRRAQARAVFESLRARASPESVVAAFHERHFPHLLFDLRLG
ncbi:hypothetical protein MYX84_15615 [Acidobacteria bacterium AH-259-O06]|nr:hypothetical protein [Acidobacteria bacterium AH-259-O06]